MALSAGVDVVVVSYFAASLLWLFDAFAMAV
jgi:hypothetical protein